jgi:acetyltransferase AlgX (SGNH hydrolase-like protein)
MEGSFSVAERRSGQRLFLRFKQQGTRFPSAPGHRPSVFGADRRAPAFRAHQDIRCLDEAVRSEARAGFGRRKRGWPRAGGARRRLRRLGHTPVIKARSPLAAAVERAKATCDAVGARLLVVALPLDVQVSPGEWRKYNTEPIDVGPTAILIEDVLAAAEGAGVASLDATPSLRGAEPGAFLHGDLHRTPKGHAALAEAIAAKLAALR